MIFNRVTVWLSLAGLVAGGILVHRMSQVQAVTPPPIPPPTRPFPVAVAASGLVESATENRALGVPVGGLVRELAVEVGDKVEVGSLLLRLDDRDLQATLPAQEAQVTVAQATLARLEGQLARLQAAAVANPRAVAREEIDTRAAEVAVAAAQVVAAQATVAQTRALLERLTVRSPLAGTVLQVWVREGEYVAPGAANGAIVVGNLETLHIRAEVDEQLAPRVRVGAAAVAYLKGDTTHPIPLRFVRIEPFVIPKTNLTGGGNERVDTRVLQVLYAFVPAADGPATYVGQQVDLFIEDVAR